MKHKFLKVAAVAVITLPVIFSSALQADEMKFGRISTSGEGCPPSSATKGDNGDYTRINFGGHFEATGDKYERVAYCNIRIETFLPVGHYNAGVNIRFKGTHDLDYAGGFAKFQAEYRYGDYYDEIIMMADGESDPEDFVTIANFKGASTHCNLDSGHKSVWLNIDSYLTARMGRAEIETAMIVSGITKRCK